MERPFAIPASQAFCERTLRHFRGILLPSSLNTGPDLTLTGLQAGLSCQMITLTFDSALSQD
jgi:hypothetical protein